MMVLQGEEYQWTWNWFSIIKIFYTQGNINKTIISLWWKISQNKIQESRSMIIFIELILYMWMKDLMILIKYGKY